MKAGTPSATAMLVAMSVVRRGAEHGLPPPALHIAARALALAARRGSVLAALARHRVGRRVLGLAERVVLPGLSAHHCARKAWLWRRLQHAPRGDAQLLWLGVGFDGLGRALLARDGDVRIIETDHPDTLRMRRSIVDERRVRMRAIELPAQLDAVLAICTSRPTVIVCEGMPMYLPPRAVVRILRALAALPSPPRLIFSALDTLRPGGRGFGRPAALVRYWLDRHREPFRWRLSPERACRHLASLGYVASARWDGEGFGEYLIDAEPAAP